MQASRVENPGISKFKFASPGRLKLVVLLPESFGPAMLTTLPELRITPESGKVKPETLEPPVKNPAQPGAPINCAFDSVAPPDVDNKLAASAAASLLAVALIAADAAAKKLEKMMWLNMMSIL
jgi:hypothetical protein